MGALRSIGLPSARVLAQGLGAVELVLGTAGIAFAGASIALGVAGAYLAFAGFVTVALVKGGAVASCGCFGTEDSPPTFVHLVLNLAAAAVALGAAATNLGGLTSVIADQPAAGLPFLGFLALGTWFAYLVLSVLPTVIPEAMRS